MRWQLGLPLKLLILRSKSITNSNFSSWPSYSEEEINSVCSVLQSNKVNYWTGTQCKDFESEFSNWAGVQYSIAMSNGTVALEAALRSLKIGPGDEVIVTPRSFIASISCIINVGATPVFSDVDLISGNISADHVNQVITESTKAIICVHLGGWPCDMDPLVSLAKKHELYIIEDCSQAHGASYKGKSVGSIGDIGTWSFCQDKIMTTGGEGGMVTTNNHKLWKKMWSYKDHGKNFNTVMSSKNEATNQFKWLHESFGTNFRMTEMQAAIGRIQLRRMKEWNQIRTKNAQKILEVCADFPTIIRAENPVSPIKHAWYKCYVYLRLNGLKSNWDRSKILDLFNEYKVPCFSGSCSEVYLEKAFDNTGFRPKKSLTNAKELGETSLMFLVHPTLQKQELSKTCSSIKSILSEASL